MTKRSTLSRLLLPLPLLLVACATTSPAHPKDASGASEAPTVVLLVRHGEKATGEDPVLTPEGQRRAEALVDVVGRAGVSAIYSTPLNRTRQTAEPLAKHLGLPVTLRDAGAGNAQTFIRELLAEQQGKTVLVVGHSNTLPALVEALTGMPIPPIGDSEYDRLVIVTVPPSGPARLIQARYGAPAAP